MVYLAYQLEFDSWKVSRSLGIFEKENKAYWACYHEYDDIRGEYYIKEKEDREFPFECEDVNERSIIQKLELPTTDKSASLYVAYAEHEEDGIGNISLFASQKEAFDCNKKYCRNYEDIAMSAVEEYKWNKTAQSYQLVAEMKILRNI